jgi:hypothetical protein
MYQGYLFLCESKSVDNCVKNKKISCSEKQVNVAKEIQNGAVIFLLNVKSNLLIGPFTASEELSTGLEPGTWNTSLNNESFSGNIDIQWENLHELKNATNDISFLKNIDDCKLTHYQIQEILEVLKESPLYTKIV